MFVGQNWFNCEILWFYTKVLVTTMLGIDQVFCGVDFWLLVSCKATLNKKLLTTLYTSTHSCPNVLIYDVC